MAPGNRIFRQLVIGLVAGTALGCVFGASVIGTMLLMNQKWNVASLFATETPIPTATLMPTITPVPTLTPTPTQAPVPTGFPTRSGTVTTSPLPSRTPRILNTHFMVGRPVALNAQRTRPTWEYLYGTTEKGAFDVHHGEEFENPTGTQLFAVADGTVVTAGSDDKPICGDAGNVVCGRSLLPGGYYGKLVVIQLAREYNGQRVFALYGHMNKISVSVGAQVKAGDPLGEIGASGVALGPHVHFEIRLGTNDYAHTRNPILWMPPLAGRGSLVGRYVDSKGNLVRGAIVDVYRPDNTFFMETETYSRDRWPAVNSDDEYKENFAVGDVPVGDYIVKINGQKLAQRVTVQDGKLTLVELGGLQ